jgi:hypothetical protein
MGAVGWDSGMSCAAWPRPYRHGETTPLCEWFMALLLRPAQPDPAVHQAGLRSMARDGRHPTAAP